MKFPAVLDCEKEILPYINAEIAAKVSKGYLRNGDLILADTAEDVIVGKAIEQGAMQELLTGKRRLPGFCDLWREYRVGDIGVFYSGLNGKCKADFGVGGARYITFMNIQENTMIDINKLEKIRVLENELQNAVEKDDLFFNTSSETPQVVGMCATLTKDLKSTYLNSFCFGFKANRARDVSSVFVLLFQ